MSKSKIAIPRHLVKQSRPLLFEMLEPRLQLSGVGLQALYAAGFAWDRSADWTPGTTPGVSTGNPDGDSHGNAAWKYVSVSGGDGKDGANPWYKNQTQTLMVWDANWYGQGVAKWAKGDDTLPTAAQTYMEDLVGTCSPIAIWMNPTGRTTTIDVTGLITLRYYLGGASGDADVAIVQKHYVTDSHSEYVPLVATTLNSPDGTDRQLPVSIQNVVIGPNDEIFVTCRYATGQGWVTLIDDALSIQIDSYPTSPSSYQDAYTWDRSVDWTPGTAPGFSTGNPDNDLRGNAAWQYVSVSGGDGVGGANPWYKNQTQPLMVWDANWCGQGLVTWARANDTLPSAGPAYMYDAGPNGGIDYSPISIWMNPTGKTVAVDVTGSITLFWQGGASGNADVAVVLKHYVSGSYTYIPLLAQTLNSTNGTSQTLSISIENLVANSQDQILVTPRYTGTTGWVALNDDNLKLKLKDPTAYQDGMIQWQRAGDWIDLPNTNPDSDVRYNQPVWKYEYVTAANTSTTWYQNTASSLTWDSPFDPATGLSGAAWSFGNNTGPAIFSDKMADFVNSVGGNRRPMVSWTNMTGATVAVDVIGDLNLAFCNGALGTIHVAVAKRKADGTYTLLYSNSTTAGTTVRLDVQNIVLEPGDEILVSELWDYGTDTNATHYVTVDDSLLSLRVNPIYWARSTDWTARSSSEEGRTVGNPDDDVLGFGAWQYSSIGGGNSDGIGTGTPWYTKSAAALVWCADWRNTGETGWVYQPGSGTSDVGPVVFNDCMVHSGQYGAYRPAMEWINPTNRDTTVDVTGGLQVVWGGSSGTATGDVEVAIVRRNADGTTTALWTTTVNSGDGLTQDLAVDSVDLSRVSLGAGERLIVTMRWNYGADTSSTHWVTMYDALKIKLSDTIDITETTAEDAGAPLTISYLAGDSHFTSSTMYLEQAPLHGTADRQPNGTIVYTPASNYNGPDTFTYGVDYAGIGPISIEVNVNVTAVNDPPVAVDDTLVTSVGRPANIDVLANDTDADIDPLTVSVPAIGSPGSPGHGRAIVQEDKSILYIPNAGYAGVDSFTYQASDGTASSAETTVSVTVNNPRNLYVSPTGDDNNTGLDWSQALLTLDGARQKVQSQSYAGSTAVEVIFAAGTYPQTGLAIYDNFDGSSLNASLWTPSGTGVVVSGGNLVIGNTSLWSSVYSTQSFGDASAQRSYVFQIDEISQTTAQYFGLRCNSGNTYHYAMLRSDVGLDPGVFQLDVTGTPEPGSFTADSGDVITLTRTATNWQVYRNGILACQSAGAGSFQAGDDARLYISQQPGSSTASYGYVKNNAAVAIYDDFDGSSLDKSLWAPSGTETVSGGNLTIGNTSTWSSVYSAQSFGDASAQQSYVFQIGTTSSTTAQYFGLRCSSGNTYHLVQLESNPLSWGVDVFRLNVAGTYSANFSVSSNDVITLTRTATKWQVYKNGQYVLQSTGVGNFQAGDSARLYISQQPGTTTATYRYVKSPSTSVNFGTSDSGTAALPIEYRADDLYTQNWIWNRSSDWTAGTTQGSTTGNPDGDANGNPTWEYVYVAGGDGKDGPNPWYTQSPIYDNFDGISLNTSLWTPTGTVTVNGGSLAIGDATAWSSVYSTQSFGDASAQQSYVFQIGSISSTTAQSFGVRDSTPGLYHFVELESAPLSWGVGNFKLNVAGTYSDSSFPVSSDDIITLTRTATDWQVYQNGQRVLVYPTGVGNFQEGDDARLFIAQQPGTTIATYGCVKNNAMVWDASWNAWAKADDTLPEVTKDYMFTAGDYSPIAVWTNPTDKTIAVDITGSMMLRYFSGASGDADVAIVLKHYASGSYTYIPLLVQTLNSSGGPIQPVSDPDAKNLMIGPDDEILVTCRYATGSGFVELIDNTLQIKLLTPTPKSVVISGSEPLSVTWAAAGDCPGAYRADLSTFLATYGLTSFNSLFVDGMTATRAREPDVGYYTIVSVAPATNTTAFTFTEGNISGSWANLTDVEICTLRRFEQTREKIASVNDTTNVVTFAVALPSGQGYDWDYDYNSTTHLYSQATARYWVENLLTGLDTPGEWYFNKTSKYLYYMPLSTQSINSVPFTIPVTQQLLNLTNTSYVSFTGMSFVETDWKEDGGYHGYQGSIGAMTTLPTIGVSGGNGFGFTDNLVARVGGYALKVSNGGAQIIENELCELGAGGILLAATALEGERLSLNEVHDYGTIYHDAIGVLSTLVGETRITNNQIYNGNYTGIQVGWCWNNAATAARGNLVQDNEIYNVMQELCDGAGIYLNGYQSGTVNGYQSDTVVQANYIHDVQKTSNHYYSSPHVITGLYLDEGSAGIVLRGNLVVDTRQGLEVNHGVYPSSQPGYLKPCMVDSNIFVNVDGCAVALDGYPNATLHANVFAWTKTPSGPISLIILPSTGDVESYGHYLCDYNLYDTHLATVNANSSLLASRRRGQDVHSLTTDPLFVDPANGDYRLYSNSPAILELGFAAPWLDPPALLVENVVVNDANAQRSTVNRLTITFNTIVTMDVGAFEVLKLGAGGGLVNLAMASMVQNGRTVATLAFSGGQAEFGSLKDGQYQLTIRDDKVRDSVTGAALDGDGNGLTGGNYLFGNRLTDNFFRTFGDSDGDRDVDSIDLLRFRQAYSGAAKWYFDFDDDGDVDSVDLLRFRQRYA